MVDIRVKRRPRSIQQLEDTAKAVLLGEDTHRDASSQMIGTTLGLQWVRFRVSFGLSSRCMSLGLGGFHTGYVAFTLGPIWDRVIWR